MLDDEMEFVLKVYGEQVKNHIGNDIAASFFAESEQFVDSIKSLSISNSMGDFNLKYYQDFSIGKEHLLTDCSLCKIGPYSFIKIITPFTRERSYDFIIAKANEMEHILSMLNVRREQKQIPIFNFPIIGLDFEEIKKNTIDFLLNEELRSFCISKHIKLKRGIVLEGPPGCGKSLTIRWIKNEALKNNIDFVQFEDPKAFLEERSRYFEKNKKHIFVFEDFDSLIRERNDNDHSPNTVLGTILNTLDGVEEITDVVSIFTTNKVDLFDSAFMRPGRIEKIFTFNPPSNDERVSFMNNYIPDYKEFYSDIESYFKSIGVAPTYAIMKGICDNINIAEFNLGKQTKDTVLQITGEVIKRSNKNNETKQVKDFVL